MKLTSNLATLIWNACCDERWSVSEEIGVPADRSSARSLHDHYVRPAQMERRQTLRLKVHFRSSFSASNMVEGDGTVVDLSDTGCRIATLIQVPRETKLEVRLMLPNDLTPITIESCIVRWSWDHEFGVQFLKTREEDRARLSQFVGKIQSNVSSSETP